MSNIETTLWDPADHLTTDEDVAHYLDAVFEDGDPELIAAALADVARAKGLTKLAEEAGLAPESSDQTSSGRRNSELAVVLNVMRALGLKLRVAV